MEVLSLFEILSGIISLITLIVFFVLASNISAIKKTNKLIYNVLLKYGVKDNVVKEIECRFCHKKYDEYLKRCPHCNLK